MMTNENERRQPGRFRRMMSRMGFGRPEYPASYDPAAAPPAPAAGPGPAAQGAPGRPGTQPGAAPQPGVEPAPQQQGAAHPGAQQPAPEAPAAYGYARPQPPPAHAPASAPPAPGHQPQQRGGIALAAPAQQQGLHRAEPRKEQPVLLGDVVAGMAMRDLNLVDALLATVEDMEDGADDPALLDRLFEIDNLATRMRRHSENLLVLTGQSPVDPDEEPVPVLDVARAAISEIKDYARIQVGRLPNGYVLGTVADDVSHLLAELLDNATEHSPEHAQVVISAQPTADGGLLYIVEDEGIGIPREEIEDLNSRLAGPPRMDQRSLRHMGLYVASVIADRHGLTVQLEARAFRGVSAYAVVPKELLSDRGPRPDQGRGLIRTAPPSNARSGGDDIAPPRGGRPDGGRAPLAGQPGTASAPVGLGRPPEPRTEATRSVEPLRDQRRPGPAAAGGAAGSAGGASGGAAGRALNGSTGTPNGNGIADGAKGSKMTSAGLPRRSAHRDPLKAALLEQISQDLAAGDQPARHAAPDPAEPVEDRAAVIRDELGDFLEGEAEAQQRNRSADGEDE